MIDTVCETERLAVAWVETMHAMGLAMSISPPPHTHHACSAPRTCIRNRTGCWTHGLRVVVVVGARPRQWPCVHASAQLHTILNACMHESRAACRHASIFWVAMQLKPHAVTAPLPAQAHSTYVCTVSSAWTNCALRGRKPPPRSVGLCCCSAAQCLVQQYSAHSVRVKHENAQQVLPCMNTGVGSSSGQRHACRPEAAEAWHPAYAACTCGMPLRAWANHTATQAHGQRQW